MDRIRSAAPRSGETKLIYSTSDGRQQFPDILQVTYGEKAVIGFDRYGRLLGAVVPVEAIRMLAGFDDAVDDDVRKRIVRAAHALLAQLPDEQEMLRASNNRVDIMPLDEVEAARRNRTTYSKPARRKAATN